MLVIMVPVILGLMGFAVDLGRLYMAREELKTAANAMALAAASKLIGTTAATDAATAAAQAAIDTTSGTGNKYYFGGFNIGQSNGTLASVAAEPSYYAAVADATGTGDSAGGGGSTSNTVDGTQAKYAQVTITAEAPLVFWGLLSLGQARKTTLGVTAVAGISAPLCTACDIDNLTIAAIDATDTTDFGYVRDTQYTFAYSCGSSSSAAGLATSDGSSAALVPYLILDRYNAADTVFSDEYGQLARIGAGGLPGAITSSTPGGGGAYSACFSVNTPEYMWSQDTDVTSAACTGGGGGGAGGGSIQTVNSVVSALLCGLTLRFDNTTIGSATACQSIAGVDTLTSAYQADTDLIAYATYGDYIGNGRRIVTVPVIDALSTFSTMNILGYRQFLIQPNTGATNIDPTDQYGRFLALYMGYPAPIKAGEFSSCQIVSGPGKVVLHQ